MSDFTFPWEQTADDGRFRCWVVQDEGGYSGTLYVNVIETGETILEERVSIAYGAMFGPDIDDVATWQDKSIRAMDAWIADHDS